MLRNIEDGFHLTYENKHDADGFELWSKYTLDNRTVYDLTLRHFGELPNKTVVDFGCGNGKFMKHCLDNGASTVTGIDNSIFMIESSAKTCSNFRDNVNFFVHDCDKPLTLFEDTYDFASSHFVLHYSQNLKEFRTHLANMCFVLKPGGMAVVCIPRMAQNEREQKDAEEFLGYSIPVEKTNLSADIEPACWEKKFLKPDTLNGKGFLKEWFFTKEQFAWSASTLKDAMTSVGFTDVQVLQPKGSVLQGRLVREFSCCCLLAVGVKD